MADLDQALARAFARRGSVSDLSKTPAPHFAVERSLVERLHGSEATLGFDRPVVLDWPATVRALERDHGQRFEQLADSLELARIENGIRSVFFTSCHRSEGRSTLVLGLARALARRPSRTVVVDADLAGPMLARSLGLRPRWGLDDVLSGAAALGDVLLDAQDDHLAIVPLRAGVVRPRENLTATAWSTAMARLRRDFDHVLIDGSPIFAGMGSPALPRSVDAAILVHNRAMTGDRAVLRAREALESGGIPLLGIAETFV